MNTQAAVVMSRGAKAAPARAKRGRPLDAAKHERIIAAATDAFLAHGFNAASMDLVARRAKVSKVTVYTHFKSKEALFGAIIDGLAGRLVARINRFALGDMAPAPALRRFGRMYLELALASSSLALHRVVIAESARVPALGQLIYQNGPRQIVSSLADFLARQRALRLADPRLAAEQFLGMVLGHSQLQLLLNARPPAEVRAGIEKTVDHAVEVFLNGALSATPRRAHRSDAGKAGTRN
jgi:TetR/AcrR family transcriptional regulator, mexJK operon transcriptional repressor